MPYRRVTPSLSFPVFHFAAWLRCAAVFALLWLNIGWTFGAAHEPPRQASVRVSRHASPPVRHLSKAQARTGSEAKKVARHKARQRVAHKRKHITDTERPLHASKLAPKSRRQAARIVREPRGPKHPARVTVHRKRQPVAASRTSAHGAHAAHARLRLLPRCGYTPKSRALLRSRSVFVIDERTQTVLTEKQADTVMPIASISKLMTAVVSLDAKHALDAPLNVTVQDQDFDKFTGSRLSVGSVLPRHDMLHIALMSSENRAAAALSRDYAGGRPGFVAAMNAKARALGMRHTRFVNGTGLSPHNVSTARDLARLVAAASRYPLIRAYSTDRAQLVFPGGRRASLSYHNSNALVRGGDRSIVLQKTGFINEAGHCVVVRMMVHGRPIDIVVLGAPGPRDHLADVIRIRRWLRCSLR
ncbi:D-alanyl-D-alanine carboxypeptidase [bacterium M00.F.Ca.ET.228.01.1.1]|uniref:serine hydrolase n=1 Tax=Paraburkholderia phenoliruptrix TaxID=252970 RepID=UPI0010928FA2|nr:serine hydrolase [Paraburkholderia phenoliruptrix]TGP39899.1 D-alanyl-D-alanine carboxypeptidase [bacterium M00.F.Ca.ET.228.01.1.1]TGR95789.1 D-alanyl-D-alanine carboxypeptidase [bacterium M00.F.Ca.ET.191.01.1.1]TGT96843.1 D-alanyl-D-alanine carboxypeptidase [bacterium M00.F.Ca.ET.155.01.1.1]MBW0445801.1 serine hydrolase [Paraburkholderia phenoliruptrix]MBW9101655.1 serine hydrolase [Paraburkholderia phenoliruptrix]